MSSALARWVVEPHVFAEPEKALRYPIDVIDYTNDFTNELYGATNVPCIMAVHPAPRGAVAYFHGNSENLSVLCTFLGQLSEKTGLTALALEYPGYHGEGARPTEAGCFRAAEDFALALKARLGGMPLVYFGYSMGCALALHCAARIRGDAVVLVAPFVSAASVVLARNRAELFFAPMWAPFDVFVTRIDAKHSECSIIVFTGDKDDVVPECHGVKLANIHARFGKSVHVSVPGADHESIRSQPIVYTELSGFLDANLPPWPGGGGAPASSSSSSPSPARRRVGGGGGKRRWGAGGGGGAGEGGAAASAAPAGPPPR
jgi:hypothetical protein